jgi:hypothetical protein
MSPSCRARPTCPCRSAPCPKGRRPRPIWTLRVLIGGDPARAFMSPLRIIGPARIEVCISSPVRSRKPVLMNTIRSFTAWMQAARLAGAAFLVHHAHLDRVARQPEQVFHRIEQIVGEGAFLRPVHLGLDDIDAAGAAVARRLAQPLARSCSADRAGDTASMMPSGASLPSASRIAGLVIRWPTLRTNSRLRPGRVKRAPSGAVHIRGRHSSARVMVLPPFSKRIGQIARIRPSQLE